MIVWAGDHMSTRVGANNVVAHVYGGDSIPGNWLSNSSLDFRGILTASIICCMLRTVRRLKNHGRMYTKLEKTNLIDI